MKDKDGVVHHASNAKNCSICMNLWIARENEITKIKLAKIERDCMKCKKTLCDICRLGHNGKKCQSITCRCELCNNL